MVTNRRCDAEAWKGCQEGQGQGVGCRNAAKARKKGKVLVISHVLDHFDKGKVTGGRVANITLLLVAVVILLVVVVVVVISARSIQEGAGERSSPFLEALLVVLFAVCLW